jgi:hypothetical protein
VRQWELAQASSPCLIDKRNCVRAGSCATTRLRQQRKTYHPPWFDALWNWSLEVLMAGGWEEMWICGGRGPTRLAEAQSVRHVGGKTSLRKVGLGPWPESSRSLAKECDTSDTAASRDIGPTLPTHCQPTTQPTLPLPPFPTPRTSPTGRGPSGGGWRHQARDSDL